MIKTGKDKVKNIIKENEDLKEIKKIEPQIRKLNKESTDAYLREALRLLMKK